jgi:hypothetical protein
MKENDNGDPLKIFRVFLIAIMLGVAMWALGIKLARVLWSYFNQ